MSSSNSAIGALILVPIVIAVSAAFIAIKFSHVCKRLGRHLKNFWNESVPWSDTSKANRRRKLRRSNLRSTQLYADSWIDLESIDSREDYSTFVNQTRPPGRRFDEEDMASVKERSARVELRESAGGGQEQREITTPQPLRIIKRSQTVAHCAAPREAIRRSRGASAGSDESKGSPPQGVDRPLTVRKKRPGRATVVGVGAVLDEPAGQARKGSVVEDLLKQYSNLNEPEEDLEVTPKAQALANLRANSAGAFLKSELYQHKQDIEPTSHADRDNRHSLFTPKSTIRRPPRPPPSASPPKISERRPSKSKNFFLRAIGGRMSDDSKSVRRKESEVSKVALVRRLSRSRKPSCAESCTDSIISTDSGYSFEPGSLDTTDISVNSRLSSYMRGSPSYSSSDRAAGPDVFVLCPQIIITPEISSLDTGNCFLWVAIEITGTLQKADGCENRDSGGRLSNVHISDLWPYGRLHSMRIDLHPGRGCLVSEIIGDLHKTKIVRAGETQLILAKIRFSKFVPPTHIRESSSDGLIAQLENDLGDTLTPYLTVRLTYKHSAFPNIKGHATTAEGMSMHITRLQTEATAVIKRHNPLSAWSPRNSQTCQTINSPLEANPLINLAETYLPSESARDVIRKLASERTPIPLEKRFENAAGSSEETVKPFLNTSIAARIGIPELPSPLVQTASAKGTMAPPPLTGPFARLDSIRSTYTDERHSEDVDPARKVWSEMRRASRGGGRSRHPRGSISADHYFSVDEGCSPSQLSSFVDSPSNHPNRKGDSLNEIKEERSRIMDLALKNKRSVGQESLKSFVPSVVGKGKGAGGPLSSLGLSVGRTWGWNGNWW
ncbi:uncharacterized protein L3040_002075 [Drepanopeziza brunnea f. sp. 'multigermtubi']|uniref:Ubiquitin-conjugating enzyme n=1 Tax=Marssonina brunnea f. sp. multigermtubi (strain MB_m1) TaxID=1072389 RepID=K1Y0N6_MARBU|nr:uncharacterized protein MBM_02891 [Drepanopeziza brunnea f. sp. 'multigermtubi' MB_m1]EKD18649.1 hypothetical protein MBM_02891 [Drepanopeziza brunnea f. sp. 'multigermtubi' MB_m1]KAJ5052323.1 hypothetical protein L3040_002075 [Drepanopeziza brunnea f. sp. 'multigermtubi']